MAEISLLGALLLKIDHYYSVHVKQRHADSEYITSNFLETKHLIR